MDLMDPSSIDQALSTLQLSLQEAAAATSTTPLPLIGLVNDAGLVNDSPLEFLAMDKFRVLMETNVMGPTYLTQVYTYTHTYTYIHIYTIRLTNWMMDGWVDGRLTD